MFCKTTLALPRAIVYQSQCSHCSGNIQELFANLFSLPSFSLRKHLCHADCPGIPAPILTTFLCTPAAARARSAQGASQFAAGYAATFGAPCKVLSISNIAIFRVTKIPTLKMVKCLLISYLQVALYAAELQVCTATRSPCEDQALPLSWAPPSSTEGGKSPQGQPCCRLKNSEAMAMRSGAHEGLTCPLEKGVRGIETSGSGYLRQQIRGGHKGRAERQGLGQSPNKITRNLSSKIHHKSLKTYF